MLRVLLLLLFMFGEVVEGRAQTFDSSCIFAANGAATVYIEYKYVTDEGVGVEKGSGFIISPAGHVITAAHVVSPHIKDVAVQSATVTVRVGGLLNPPVEATIISRDPSVDVALLQLPPRPGTSDWSTIAVGNQTTLPTGARLIGLGFGSAGDLAVVPEGEKTAHNTIVDGELKPWWQTSLALNPGNSGGPIFGELGTVVGIAVAKNEGAQLVTYIIPIARAQHLIEAASVTSAQAGRCAVFPECRHASHGIQSYAIDETKNKWGEWRRGGYNRGAFCNDFLAELQAAYPASTFTFVRDDEDSRDAQPPFRVIQYRYFCEFRRRENPIYELKRSIACLQ